MANEEFRCFSVIDREIVETDTPNERDDYYDPYWFLVNAKEHENCPNMNTICHVVEDEMIISSLTS